MKCDFPITSMVQTTSGHISRIDRRCGQAAVVTYYSSNNKNWPLTGRCENHANHLSSVIVRMPV